MSKPSDRPLFPLGFPVNIGYLGLCRADQPPVDASGNAVNLGYVVRGFQLKPQVRECMDTGRICITYPGWEYLVARVYKKSGEWAERYREYQWYDEATLIRHGYAPPAAHAPADPDPDDDDPDEPTVPDPTPDAGRARAFAGHGP